MSKQKIKQTRKSNDVITGEDIKNSMNSIFKQVEEVKHEYFNKNGKSGTEGNACAIKTRVKNKDIYKVLVDKKNELYNPLKDTNNLALIKTEKKKNDRIYRFRETNPKAFDAYVGFLRTKYDSYLNRAQRDL